MRRSVGDGDARPDQRSAPRRAAHLAVTTRAWDAWKRGAPVVLSVHLSRYGFFLFELVFSEAVADVARLPCVGGKPQTVDSWKSCDFRLCVARRRRYRSLWDGLPPRRLLAPPAPPFFRNHPKDWNSFPSLPKRYGGHDPYNAQTFPLRFRNRQGGPAT